MTLDPLTVEALKRCRDRLAYWCDQNHVIGDADAAALSLAEAVLATATALPAETGEDWWIEWRGGARPVGPHTRVEIMLRSGIGTGRGNAEQWSWSHENDPSDIIAYRPAPQRKE